MSEPVNQLHRTLRVLSLQDLQSAIAFAQKVISIQGYDTIAADPGMRAWVEENKPALKLLSDARRKAYDPE